jgi:hypothetical protein
LESKSRRRHYAGVVPLLVGTALVACAPAQLYPGPPRAKEELVVIETRTPSKISMIDGQPVNIRKAEILPGPHSLEFYGEFGELLAAAGVVVGERQSRPLLKTRCTVEVGSMEAGRYEFSANAEIDQRSSGPDPKYRWHKTSVNPRLVDADGTEIAGLTCDQTCRLRGRKNQSNVSRACEFDD